MAGSIDSRTIRNTDVVWNESKIIYKTMCRQILQMVSIEKKNRKNSKKYKNT